MRVYVCVCICVCVCMCMHVCVCMCVCVCVNGHCVLYVSCHSVLTALPGNGVCDLIYSCFVSTSNSIYGIIINTVPVNKHS